MRSVLIPLVLLAGCAPSNMFATDADGAAIFSNGGPEDVAAASRLAYQYLELNSDRFEDVGAFVTERVSVDGLQHAHVRIQQLVNDVPVFGGISIVHLRPDGTIRSATDGWHRHIEVDTTPRLTEAEAIEIAVAQAGGAVGMLSSPVSELQVLRLEDADHLVYRVDVPKLEVDDPTAPRLFVDAHTGSVVMRYEQLQTLDGEADTAHNGFIQFPITEIDGVFVLRGAGVGTYESNDSDSPSRFTDMVSADHSFQFDEAAANAQFGAASAVGYFRDIYGRDGIDGMGGPLDENGVIPSGVHYGSSYNNAFWTGEAMLYGDGDGARFASFTSLDIAAHELTHGVTEFSAGLIYQGESGALNESMSDVFGVAIEHHVRGMGPGIWTIGEDAFTPAENGDALRYMNDPTADGASREHYSTRYIGGGDNGGVHWNSGIGNLAFYLAVEGGTHPNPAFALDAVDGIGMERAAAIWYRGLNQYMTPSTTFDEARTALESAAIDLYGADSVELKAVSMAWATVGVGSVPDDNAPIPAPEPTPTPEDPEPVQIGRNVSLDDLAGALESNNTYLFDLPEGIGSLTVSISGGLGDADLSVRALDGSFDCSPAASGNDERCEATAPAAGTYEVTLYAYDAYSGVRLSVESEYAPSAEDVWTLRAANEIDLSTLQLELGERAADQVFYNREHSSVAALDLLPYIGPSALAGLSDLGRARWGRVWVEGIEEGSPEARAILDLIATSTVSDLVTEAGLPSRIATEVAGVAFSSLTHLRDAGDVDATGFDHLLRYVTDGASEPAPSEPTPSGLEDLGSALGAVVSGDTCGAGEDHEQTCGGGYFSSEDRGFVWMAPTSGTFQFDTIGSSYDTVLELEGAGVDQCNDDTGEERSSSITVDLLAGDVVHLFVEGYSASCGGFELNITGL